VIVAGLLLAIGVAMLWQSQSASVELSDLSRHEFLAIQKAVRQAIWRKAIGKGSFWKLVTAPGSLWALATSSIDQIELLPIPGEVEVRTQSRSGTRFYYVANRNHGAGESNWQVMSEGATRQSHTVSLNGFQNLRLIKVQGGLGLIGGKLSHSTASDELDEFIKQAQTSSMRHDNTSSTNETKSSFLDPVNMGYDVQPLDPSRYHTLPLNPIGSRGERSPGGTLPSGTR